MLRAPQSPPALWAAVTMSSSASLPAPGSSRCWEATLTPAMTGVRGSSDCQEVVAIPRAWHDRSGGREPSLSNRA